MMFGKKTDSVYDCVSPLYFFFLLKYEETASGSFDSEAEKKNTFCECFDSEAEKKNKFSALAGYRKVHWTFLHPYPARICPRFPGKCSAHRAFDFLRKSLGLEIPNLNPNAAASRH